MKTDVDSKRKKQRRAENEAQNDWRQRAAHNKILAEAPLSIGVQRMLIEDDHVAAEVANAFGPKRTKPDFSAQEGLSAYDPKRT